MAFLDPAEQEDGRLLLRLRGKFDSDSAWALLRRVSSVQERAFVLDFTAVDPIEDSSMIVLADLLRRYRGRVSLNGLRDHHLRLLAYLGVWEDGNLPAP
jgi:anti-anti-sigma regulatory factor